MLLHCMSVVSIPTAENFPSMGLAAHILLGLSGRISLPQGASWVACIQKPPCTASSWNVKAYQEFTSFDLSEFLTIQKSLFGKNVMNTFLKKSRPQYNCWHTGPLAKRLQHYMVAGLLSFVIISSINTDYCPSAH